MASTNIQSFPGKVGVSNTNPIHTLDIGSNVYIDDAADTKVRVMGNIHASGITVDGNITVIETDNHSVKDPVLLLASGSTGTSDTGIIMKRADGDANVAVFYDEGVGLKICHTMSSGDEIHLTADTANALATSVYGPVTIENTGVQSLSVSGGAQINKTLQIGTIANLYVDTTTSNVGIGTNAPAYKLDVHGESNVGVLTASTISVAGTTPTGSNVLEINGTANAVAYWGDGSNLTSVAMDSDLQSNVTILRDEIDSNLATARTDLQSNVTILRGEIDSNLATARTDLQSNVTILRDEIDSNLATARTDLQSNVTILRDTAITFTGTKTFQDDVVLESNLRVQGDLLVANTVNMTVSDPILELGSNNLNTGDVGLVMTRHGDSNSNVAIFFDETADILKLGYTLNGANDTTLEFDSNALAVSVQGALYGEIAGSNTITASTIYGEIAGSNAITASTGTFSGDFEVGTANLFVDTTTSNVGVGTNTPAYKLDVHGTANVGTLNATLMYSNASANIVAWNTSTNEVIDSGLERGFTEHPVEAMTDPIHYAEGHGTYEADASSKSIWFNSSFGSPFDYVIENNMWESDANWSSSNVYNNANWTTDVGGTRHYGEWLQLKNPYAITLAYTDVYPRALSTNGTSRGPGAGVILGSNDGENWYKLTEFSGKTYTNGVATKIDVNATTPYTWYRIVTSKLANATAIDTRVDIGEWRLFAEKPVTRMENVHISGDLSSETLQTGYIKWPKVPLKANASEGYVASVSSNLGFGAYSLFN